MRTPHDVSDESLIQLIASVDAEHFPAGDLTLIQRNTITSMARELLERRKAVTPASASDKMCETCGGAGCERCGYRRPVSDLGTSSVDAGEDDDTKAALRKWAEDGPYLEATTMVLQAVLDFVREREDKRTREIVEMARAFCRPDTQPADYMAQFAYAIEARWLRGKS